MNIRKNTQAREAVSACWQKSCTFNALTRIPTQGLGTEVAVATGRGCFRGDGGEVKAWAA